MVFPTSPLIQIDSSEIDALIQKCRSWQEKYREIMLLGKKLPRLAEEYQLDEARVHGCESNVWLYVSVHENRLMVHLDSDAKIVRGLLAIVLSYYQDKLVSEVSSEEFAGYLQKLELTKYLSPSRNNGIQAVSQALLNAARAQNEQ
jgi:sulfur transfer protein SufE